MGNFTPEIVFGDKLFTAIVDTIVAEKPQTILEIGSGDGTGSTMAIIGGIQTAGLEDLCRVHCIEANPDRFSDLRANTQPHQFIRCWNGSSVPAHEYMVPEEIDTFMETHGYQMPIVRYYNAETVKAWREDELRVLNQLSGTDCVLDTIFPHILDRVDMAIMDGSAFAGEAEFRRLKSRAGIIVMDDTFDIKNLGPHGYCSSHPVEWERLYDNRSYRNGCAIFRRVR